MVPLQSTRDPNKDTATPSCLSIQIYEPMGDILIQTTMIVLLGWAEFSHILWTYPFQERTWKCSHKIKKERKNLSLLK